MPELKVGEKLSVWVSGLVTILTGDEWLKCVMGDQGGSEKGGAALMGARAGRGKSMLVPARPCWETNAEAAVSIACWSCCCVSVHICTAVEEQAALPIADLVVLGLEIVLIAPGAELAPSMNCS